jgi:hypothetical protein
MVVCDCGAEMKRSSLYMHVRTGKKHRYWEQTHGIVPATKASTPPPAASAPTSPATTPTPAPIPASSPHSISIDCAHCRQIVQPYIDFVLSVLHQQHAPVTTPPTSAPSTPTPPPPSSPTPTPPAPTPPVSTPAVPELQPMPTKSDSPLPVLAPIVFGTDGKVIGMKLLKPEAKKKERKREVRNREAQTADDMRKAWQAECIAQDLKQDCEGPCKRKQLECDKFFHPTSLTMKLTKTCDWCRSKVKKRRLPVVLPPPLPLIDVPDEEYDSQYSL